jgi:predicted RNase H-like HicB family nuclease
MKSYTAIIEECEEGGYVAQCAEIKNAFAQGETVEEAQENLVEVIGLILECEKDVQMRKMKGVKFFTRNIAVL